MEIGLLALIVYSPWGNSLFATHPLPAKLWLVAVGGTIAMLLEEARNWLLREHTGQAGDHR